MRNILLTVLLCLLLVSFAYAETSVLSTKAAVRKIARRTRSLVRKIEHRATGRRLHGRTRGVLRRLFKRLHGMIRVVHFGHRHSQTITERRQFTQLLLTIAARLKVIRDKMAQSHEEKIHVQPTVNIHGQVNLGEIRKSYLEKMKAGIKTLSDRYKLIIKKLKLAAKDPKAEQQMKDQISKLQQKLKDIKSKLDAVRAQLKAARDQVKKEKKETAEIKNRIKKVKADAMKTVKSLREMIAKLRKDQKALADKASLVATVKRLKNDIHNVKTGVRDQLKRHHKELADKIKELHDRWSKKRQELEDAWADKEDAMKKRWARQRAAYEATIRRLRKSGRCEGDEIYNIRTGKCVKLNQRRPAKIPKPAVPSSKLGQFSASLKKTKETVAKMNKALKKMSERERN